MYALYEHFSLLAPTPVAEAAPGHSDLDVITPGKAADLMAVQGNPLDDIRALNTPGLVVSRGRAVV